GEMLRQLEMNATSDVVKGSVFFRWAHLRGGVGDTLRTWYTGRSVDPILPTPPEPPRQPVVTMNELKVVMPANDVTIGLNATGHNIWGSSIPGLPLYMNGELVTNRTSEGFFSVFASLENGPNIFEFTQPGQPSVTRNISRSAPAAQPAPTPVPGATPAPTIPDRVFSRNEPYYATVTAEVAWLYPRATESGGTNWLLEQGMQDRIIASARNEQWLRLSNGGWISASNVERTGAQSLTENILHEGTFSRDGHIETVSWQISNGSAPPAARATFEDRLLTVYFGMQTEPPQMSHVAPPANSIFENMAYGTTSEGIPYISFRVRENVRLNGYDLTVENNRLQLVAMTPQTLYQNWRMPFYGFTFVVDAGHGGTDYGALGPMGRLMSEKHINLINAVNLANRLESLGAEVVMVRNNNESEHTLLSRVIASRNARPDMFISTHANSVAYTTDATNIRGFTVWYRNYTSHNLARTFLNHMYAVNPDTNRWANVNQANFFVCRPTWAPSILLETSFMSNIDDFAWMINPMYQERLANETVAAIIAYYIQNAG
ncbi:MAG: N-acetylmuramoyl-L-alanine amidase, partial [Defluviitaleaceae bacterium]|nr:N-acetylmuramoyl-L-alanine amidase [Defluviitaleaceae bacterium]